MAGRVIQDWRRTMSGRLRSLDVETETTPRDYCRVSTELPHYSSAGCWELTKVRWQASTCRTTWMNTRFGSIAGDPRAVASSSSGLCSKRSLHLPLLTKPWSSGQSLEHYRLGQAESRGYPLTGITRRQRRDPALRVHQRDTNAVADVARLLSRQRHALPASAAPCFQDTPAIR